MTVERKAAKPPDDFWSREIRLLVFPWSEVREITQDFIQEVYADGPAAPRLSKADLCFRSQAPISLLPATGMNNSGGIRALGDTVKEYNELAVFIGDVIEAQRSR